MMENKPDFIPTRESLLSRLKDWNDDEGWSEFFKIYRHLIFSTAIKSGLREDEAEDVVQETVLSVAKTIKEFKYDPKKCRFKNWLGHLAQKRIADRFRRRSRELPVKATSTRTARTSPIERVPDARIADLDAIWQAEWKQKLMEAAMQRVKTQVRAELAKACARNSGDGRRVKEAEFLNTEMVRCGDGFAHVKHSEAVLRMTPNDPAASLAVGKFLCFVKNDWDAGLPLLSRGANATLRWLATSELNNTGKTTEGQITLGDSWRKLASASAYDEKMIYLHRARYWYLKAIAGSPVNERSNLQQQLNEFATDVPTAPGEVHIASRFVGTETIDIYSDVIRWASGRVMNDSRINHVKLEDLKSGDLALIKNSGATRILPDNVDFSTARLVVKRKPKKQAKAIFTIAPDHVRVTLSHPCNAPVDMEVTVIFGAIPSSPQ